MVDDLSTKKQPKDFIKEFHMRNLEKSERDDRLFKIQKMLPTLKKD